MYNPHPSYSTVFPDAEGNLTKFVVEHDLKLLNLKFPSSFGRGMNVDGIFLGLFL